MNGKKRAKQLMALENRINSFDESPSYTPKKREMLMEMAREVTQLVRKPGISDADALRVMADNHYKRQAEKEKSRWTKRELKRE